ncbi:hypothetical protein Dsin_021673 [Dipteronia sinensis]|uniref:Uncharacterized protein n=1 Tax=Dipteronia sinensis TaxID=43782 RepID=A0AAE0A075_9ROSI|nr:hypothetical protein Dsin_021673 [Dipteronia sinensis]
MLARVTQFGMPVVTHAFIGHIGEIKLAGYALTQILTLTFVNGILLGMSSATETLCGQAFGAKKYHMLGSKDTMTWLLVQCGEHWKGNRFTGPISFSVRLTKKYNGAYDELVETIYQRTGVSRDKAELKLTSHVKTEDDTVTLSIISDDDVEFMIIHKEKVWATIDVEFFNKHEF